MRGVVCVCCVCVCVCVCLCVCVKGLSSKYLGVAEADAVKVENAHSVK